MSNEDDAIFQSLVAARAHLPLPGQSDFCRELGGDAGYAWRNFGGLSLDAAYRKFTECPQTYQEDFMWMFPQAFEYYYPVVDRYLRTAFVTDDYDESHAWILGCGLESQFHWADGSRPPDYVVSEIRALAQFVRENLYRFSTDPGERERIDACWAELQETLSAVK
jgi:hypothetical protein